jgi:hypothetical protein
VRRRRAVHSNVCSVCDISGRGQRQRVWSPLPPHTKDVGALYPPYPARRNPRADAIRAQHLGWVTGHRLTRIAQWDVCLLALDDYFVTAYELPQPTSRHVSVDVGDS